MMRILNLCAINAILALSLNLTNGFTGLFSLGTAGFMAVGAYTSALLTMPPSVKIMNFFMEPINPLLLNINVHFLLALLIAGDFIGSCGVFDRCTGLEAKRGLSGYCHTGLWRDNISRIYKYPDNYERGFRFKRYSSVYQPILELGHSYFNYIGVGHSPKFQLW